MSGPIVRKYGFPNFDEIFGKRELEHGVEDKPQDLTENNMKVTGTDKADDSKTKPEAPKTKA